MPFAFNVAPYLAAYIESYTVRLFAVFGFIDLPADIVALRQNCTDAQTDLELNCSHVVLKG